MATLPDLQNMRKQFYTQRRGEADQSLRQAEQQQDDALKRRMVSLGQTGSGAQMAMQRKSQEGLLDARNRALGEIQGQELQSQEADFGRSFAAQEAGLQRGFQKDLASADLASKNRFFDVEQGNKLKQLELAQKQFDLEKDAQEFNKQMALAELNEANPGLLDSLGLGGIDLKNLSPEAAAKIFGAINASQVLGLPGIGLGADVGGQLARGNFGGAAGSVKNAVNQVTGNLGIRL